MSKIFLAFSGYQNPSFSAAKNVLEDGYEVWDLSAMTFDNFVQEIKAEIPPINDNVTDENNYYNDQIFRRSVPEVYENCRWGLLLPIQGDRSWGFDDESLFCINLFSPEFLYPMFYVEDLGIKAPPIPNDKFLGVRGLQEQWGLFDESFVNFHKKMLPALPLTQWVLDRVQEWSVEDFRIWNGCLLFNELKRYHNSKKPWLAGLEYTEQGVIMETLFTLADERTEISYRLKKRMGTMLQGVFPEIERDIHELYKRRSKYVHGTTFQEIQRSGQDYGRLTDFDFTAKCTKYLRYGITAYLYLHSSDFKQQEGMERIVDVLEAAILDEELRERLTTKVNEVCGLIPQV